MNLGPDAVIRFDEANDIVTVEIIGQAGAAIAHDLRAGLDAYAARPNARVLVDLSSATFVDASTLGVLALSATRFKTARFAVACPSGDIRTAFELAGLDRVLSLHTTREEALIS